MSIPLEDLEVRGVYKLRARNLTLGVWDGQNWVGIREKFNHLSLDRSEIPGDDTVRGSARAIEKIAILPKSVSMSSDHRNRTLFDYLTDLGGVP
jgi:hypothetical protein